MVAASSNFNRLSILGSLMMWKQAKVEVHSADAMPAPIILTASSLRRSTNSSLAGRSDRNIPSKMVSGE